MDTSNPVLSGLIRKRQEIMDQLDAAQSRVRQLIMDMDALDGTIRLFAPEADLAVVRVRPTVRRHEASRGDTSRIIGSLLREHGPMTTRDVTAKVMEARGLNQADAALVATLRLRTGASLRGMRERGKLWSEGKGAAVRWGLAG